MASAESISTTIPLLYIEQVDLNLLTFDTILLEYFFKFFFSRQFFNYVNLTVNLKKPN